MLKSYVKIFPASGKFQDWFIGKEVEITEKIDGSQFVFGKCPEGKLYMRSKGAVIDPSCPPKLFAPAVQHVLSIQYLIRHNSAFYGEAVCSRRHNTLTYGEVPPGNVMLYGLTDFERTYSKVQQYEELAVVAMLMGMDVVPLLYQGVLHSLADLLPYMQTDSALGNCKVEGVVVKNYKQDALMGGEYFPMVAMKYVSEAFKEQHVKNPEYRPVGNTVEERAISYRTDARWNKAIQHLRDSSQLSFAPKDIGELMKELDRDFEEECKEEVKDFLWSVLKKQFFREIKKGFPEYYKQWLLNNGVECSPPSTEMLSSTESDLPPKV